MKTKKKNILGFEVVSGIPVNYDGCRTPRGTYKRLLRSMEDGDSFVAEDRKTMGIYQAAWREGIRVVARREGDGKRRFWRINASRQ